MSSVNTNPAQTSPSHFQGSADFHRVGQQIKEICENIHELGEVLREEINKFVDEAGEAWLAKHHHASASSSSAPVGSNSSGDAQERRNVGEDGKQGATQ